MYCNVASTLRLAQISKDGHPIALRSKIAAPPGSEYLNESITYREEIL